MPSDPSCWLWPDWPVAAGIRAVVTTRQGPGRSLPPFDRFNLGLASGDDLATVQAHRASLVPELALPSAPHWLQQVHGRVVHRVEGPAGTALLPEADAAVTSQKGQVLAILTADCLPVLLASRDGRAIGVAHAGWRGLADGVLEASVQAMGCPAGEVIAWLGPCIGAASYEVGDEVREAFLAVDAAAVQAFLATRPGHWQCDLTVLARQRLHAAGIGSLYGGGFDTRRDPRFYSYRGDSGKTGRFASLLWLE
ncbi:peptidoglycan editing factor PgeF [Frateuria aurantia]